MKNDRNLHSPLSTLGGGIKGMKLKTRCEPASHSDSSGRWSGVKKQLCCVLPLALLFSSLAAAPDAERIETEVLAKTTSSWNGSELPKYPTGQPEVTILRITIPPKTQLPMHKHLVINAGVLLTGKLTVVAEDGHTLHLKAGDSIVELVNKWHYGRNEGDEPAEIIVFYAGTPGTPITVKKTDQ